MTADANSQVIIKLAHLLDTDQFDQVKPLLAKECIYDSPSGQLRGPDQIVNSYKEHSEYAHSTFDKVSYKSSIQEINSFEFSVVYKDIISKNGKIHEYSCKQFITFNSENLVSKIKHEEIPGERNFGKLWMVENGNIAA